MASTSEKPPSPSMVDATIVTDDESAPQEIAAPASKDEEEPNYPEGLSLGLIMGAVWLCFFLVALDRTILATAVPKITDQFHSLSDVGWYGSAYMLGNCSTQLIFGRIYKFYNTRPVLLISIGIFELGSALCGAAPNSVIFIVGRSIAGLGSAGIFAGGLMTMFHAVPLHKRPIYAGLFGATFGVASVVGPLLGGVFTDKVTWRWCFYINLPAGAISAAIISVILKPPPPMVANLTLRQQLAQLDPLGTICFLPGISCLILALQWGGTTYAWSTWRIILLLTFFSVLIVVFGVIQAIKGDTGTLPPRILFHRSIAAGAYFTFCNAAAMMLLVYYLPIWFQAVKGTSAFESGIRMIPMVLSLIVASIISGAFTKRIGYYVPAMLVSPAISTVGAALITTLKPESGHAMWIGYQVLFGSGLGLAMQVSNLAAQAVLSKEDVSIGSAVMLFSQQLGGAIFVSIGQNVFINNLVSELSSIPGLGLDEMLIVNTGATDIQKAVPIQYLPEVLEKYNHALTRTFVIGTGMAAASIIGSFAMEWKSIKKLKKPTNVTAEQTTDEKAIDMSEKVSIGGKNVETLPTKDGTDAV